MNHNRKYFLVKLSELKSSIILSMTGEDLEKSSNDIDTIYLMHNNVPDERSEDLIKLLSDHGVDISDYTPEVKP